MSGIDTAARLPESVAIIGGGRWARVLCDVVCRITPSSLRVHVHSPHNAAAMTGWAASGGWADRVVASPQWPSLNRSTAVVVVNAARDHERAAERALSEGASVLIEKPMTLDATAAHRLVSLAGAKGAKLAIAHIFTFASYLERFAAAVADAGGAKAMRMSWMDPRSESRHGEAKRFDPGLPIYSDWLPHVLSVASLVSPGLPPGFDSLEFERGGALLDLRLRLGETPLRARLERNGARRERVLEVDTPRGPLTLDFSTEPGVIRGGSEAPVSADPQWDSAPRPSARMLEAFLRWAAGGPFDPRLDAAIGVRAMEVIDAAAAPYRATQDRWLAARLAAADETNDDVRYALTEREVRT